jgi:glycosyltransferase involved in cell wall biosynthesis
MGRLLLYGFHLFLIGVILFVISVIEWFIVKGFLFANTLVFYSLILFGIAFLFFLIDLGIPTVFFKKNRRVKFDPIKNPEISVGMTAFNDEDAIGLAVKDFINGENVVKVTVVDNNSVDNTFKVAEKAGARVVREKVQGFGAATIRALKEARKFGNLIVLVEGDCTFSARDLKKLFAYIENADMVVGTRTTEELIDSDSQLNWFIRYGNIFLAKLIQLRYWDKCRLTDVGCAFRMIRPEAFDKIVNELNYTGNEFLTQMTLSALKHDLKIIETAVTFKKRVGESKGVGSSFKKGLKAGIKIWAMILMH